MSTIFTKIINGEIPCYKVAEDENYFAFLDIDPNAKGDPFLSENCGFGLINLGILHLLYHAI